MKRRDAYDKDRFNRRQDAAALARVMAQLKPDIAVVLGTNRPTSEARLLDMVNETIFEFEKAVLRTRRPYKKSAKDRLCAFILLENLKSNAHAHLNIWFPHRPAWQRSSLRPALMRARHKDHFVGYGRDYDRHDSYRYEFDRASLLEQIWRRHGPGLHYHAAFIDETPGRQTQYVTKQQNRDRAPPYKITCFDWPSSQPDMGAVFNTARH